MRQVDVLGLTKSLEILRREAKLVREIRKLEKQGVKLQCLTNWNRSKRNDF